MDTTLQNSSGLSQPNSEGPAIDISALAESAKAKLGEIGGPVKDKALEVASQQKDAGADQLRCAAQAVHGAARELEQSMPQIAGYMHDIGQKLEGFASDLRSGSVDDLFSKLGEFSRNQPALIFGGAMIAGFALSRFLKSSAQVANNGAMTSGNMGAMQTGSMTMQSGTAQSGMGQGGFSGTGSFNQGRPGGGF
jgi:hypothetical protein